MNSQHAVWVENWQKKKSKSNKMNFMTVILPNSYSHWWRKLAWESVCNNFLMNSFVVATMHKHDRFPKFIIYSKSENALLHICTNVVVGRNSGGEAADYKLNKHSLFSTLWMVGTDFDYNVCVCSSVRGSL